MLSIMSTGGAPGRQIQDQQVAKGLIVFVCCGDEECFLRATGRDKSVRGKLPSPRCSIIYWTALVIFLSSFEVLLCKCEGSGGEDK